jgi:hypothetical protein
MGPPHWTLDLSHEGKHLTHGEFSKNTIWTFLKDVELFIQKDLV